ncbi:hypothetical protein GCM10020256_11450 [Streptomyces thermocoprophilus]
MPGCGEGHRSAGEAVRDVVHDRGKCIRLGERCLDGVREGGVVDGVDEAFGGRQQATAGVLGLDHPGVRGGAWRGQGQT